MPVVIDEAKPDKERLTACMLVIGYGLTHNGGVDPELRDPDWLVRFSRALAVQKVLRAKARAQMRRRLGLPC